MESMDVSTLKAAMQEVANGMKKDAAKNERTLKKQRPKFRGKRDASKYGKRHKPGVMNKTEESYAELLEARRLGGEVIAWWFESLTLKLADDCRYTSDFMVLLADGSIEFVDAKGGGPIDPKSLVKIKCAAEKFYQFKFVIEQKQAKKLGGNWKRTEY